MPLPAALQARLAKRGIVKQQPQRKPAQHGLPGGNEAVEEVFAEDYDEPTRPGLQVAELPRVVAAVPVMPEAVKVAVKETEQLEEEILACPNKSNSYHECSDFCKKKWGIKTFNPDPDMIRKRDRMLRRFPLPESWEEVADTETSRYYYWNRVTDQVSWLSPLHPKAHVTLAAKTLQEMLVKSVTAKKARVEIQENKDRIPDHMSDDDIDFERMEEDLQREEKERKRRDRRGHGGRRKKEEELDPMDPASYSDVPRGNWSSGLERHGEAKTGADVTASGPLFQQRPYPSPGDILRANRKAPE